MFFDNLQNGMPHDPPSRKATADKGPQGGEGCTISDGCAWGRARGFDRVHRFRGDPSLFSRLDAFGNVWDYLGYSAFFGIKRSMGGGVPRRGRGKTRGWKMEDGREPGYGQTRVGLDQSKSNLRM